MLVKIHQLPNSVLTLTGLSLSIPITKMSIKIPQHVSGLVPQLKSHKIVSMKIPQLVQMSIIRIPQLGVDLIPQLSFDEKTTISQFSAYPNWIISKYTPTLPNYVQIKIPLVHAHMCP